MALFEPEVKKPEMTNATTMTKVTFYRNYSLISETV